jgi:hypothetical protein
MHVSSFLHKACVQFTAANIDRTNPSLLQVNEDLDDVLKSDTFTSCVISFLRNQA